MNNALLGILIIIGFFALYWALFGQWKHNKMLSQDKIMEEKAAREEQDEKREQPEQHSL